MNFANVNPVSQFSLFSSQRWQQLEKSDGNVTKLQLKKMQKDKEKK